MSPEETLGTLLTNRKLRIAVAETTAGGAVSSRIVSVAGSSKYFNCGIVAYSRACKTELLKLSGDLLDKHGSVSREVALALARGVREISGVEIGLAETGIAGPIKGRSPKPVGTCYIAIVTPDEEHCEECHFHGNRNEIREQIVRRCLEVIVEKIGQ